MTANSSTNFFLFKDEVINELTIDLKKIKSYNNYISDSEALKKLEKSTKWLRNTPKSIVFRINTILCNQQVACGKINIALSQYSRPLPSILTFPNVPELIIVKNWDFCTEINLNKKPNEIIVDTVCGAAILRGAHIYTPGVLGMPCGLKIGDEVSVYIDIKKTCRRGLTKHYDDENKLFIGNGVVQLTREQIFNCTKNVSGIAVAMSDVISQIPQLNENILPKGHILLQNLPSILCSRILDPQPEEIILDMCAAPGNKTTHIADLMKNKGTVIALEKIKSKLKKLILNIENFSTKNIYAYCFDSTKAVCKLEKKSIFDGPPYSKESFNRILLDGPCSGLGQRPQIFNSIGLSQLCSYVPLQRKLFSCAVQLLKPGGTLVYSTCTITIAENEGIIAWALKTFPNLVLQSVKEKLKYLKMENFSTIGYHIDGLTIEQSNKLCRFEYDNDAIGFFIACFIKR